MLVVTIIKYWYGRMIYLVLELSMRFICFQDVMKIEWHHPNLFLSNSCRLRLSIFILFESAYIYSAKVFRILAHVNLQDRLLIFFIQDYRCFCIKKLFKLHFLIITCYWRWRFFDVWRVNWVRVLLLLVNDLDYLIISNYLLCVFFNALRSRSCPRLPRILFKMIKCSEEDLNLLLLLKYDVLEMMDSIFCWLSVWVEFTFKVK